MANTHDEASSSASPANPEGRRLTRGRALRQDFQDDVPHTAVARTTPDRLATALEHATLAARIADDNRAKDILLLDLREATPLVDYFVIATAPTRRQANAISIEVDQEMKRLGEKKLGIEGSEEGRWTLMDYGDFVVHVFSDEARTYYGLEDIWGDATRVEWRDSARLAREQARADAREKPDAPDAPDPDATEVEADEPTQSDL